jgi:hypothetical protein
MRNVRIKRGAQPARVIDKPEQQGDQEMNEAALLAAVAAPLATLVAMNLALLLAGEKDTLLLPGVRAYPEIALESFPVAAPVALETAAEVEEAFRLAA